MSQGSSNIYHKCMSKLVLILEQAYASLHLSGIPV